MDIKFEWFRLQSNEMLWVQSSYVFSAVERKKWHSAIYRLMTTREVGSIKKFRLPNSNLWDNHLPQPGFEPKPRERRIVLKPVLHWSITLLQHNVTHVTLRVELSHSAWLQPIRIGWHVFKLVYLNLIIARPHASQVFISTVCVRSARAGLTPPFCQCPFLTSWSNWLL